MKALTVSKAKMKEPATKVSTLLKLFLLLMTIATKVTKPPIPTPDTLEHVALSAPFYAVPSRVNPSTKPAAASPPDVTTNATTAAGATDTNIFSAKMANGKSTIPNEAPPTLALTFSPTTKSSTWTLTSSNQSASTTVHAKKQMPVKECH